MNTLNSSKTNITGDFQNLTSNEIELTLIFRDIGSGLSVIGTMFIITSYFCLFYQVRISKTRSFTVDKKNPNNLQRYQKLKMGFGNDLIFCLSISELLVSIVSFLKPKTIFSNTIDNLCIAQGFLLNFFEISGLCWTTAISFSILLTTIIENPMDLSKSYIYLLIYSILLPTILSFGPLITNSYGPSGAWCWININDRNDYKASIWSITLYIVHLIHIIFNLVAIIKCIHYFEIRALEIQEENKEESNFLRDYCIVLKFFPIILILCFIPASINRAYNFFYKIDNIVLNCIHSLIESMQGFLDSIVYSYYYRHLFKICCETEKKEKVQIEIDKSKSEILSTQLEIKSDKI